MNKSLKSFVLLSLMALVAGNSYGFGFCCGYTYTAPKKTHTKPGRLCSWLKNVKETWKTARELERNIGANKLWRWERKKLEKFITDKSLSADTPFEYAIEAIGSGNSTQILKILIKQHPDIVNQRNEYGQTLMHKAAKNGNWPCMKLLLKKGADINAPDDKRNTPLHITARQNISNDPMPMNFLLNNGANVFAENFAENNDRKLPIELLENRLSNDAHKRLAYKSIRLPDKQALKDYYAKKKNEEDETLLEYVKRSLIDTPLHQAVKNGWTKEVENIFKERIYRQGKNVKINQQNLEGDTPLHIACRLGHNEIIKIILFFCKGHIDFSIKNSTPENKTAVELLPNFNIHNKVHVELAGETLGHQSKDSFINNAYQYFSTKDIKNAEDNRKSQLTKWFKNLKPTTIMEYLNDKKIMEYIESELKKDVYAQRVGADLYKEGSEEDSAKTCNYNPKTPNFTWTDHSFNSRNIKEEPDSNINTTDNLNYNKPINTNDVIQNIDNFSLDNTEPDENIPYKTEVL